MATTFELSETDTLGSDDVRSDVAPGAIVDDGRWGHLVDKITQTALVLVVTKLIAAWAIAALWGITIQSRLLWGFVPFAGLQTTGARFRSVAAWSTAVTAVVAVVWVGYHFARRRGVHPARTWAAAAALPMAALLTFFEWWRRFDADHLVPTNWLVRILIFLAVATVLFLGFIELPGDDTEEAAEEPQRSPLHRTAAQP